MRTGCRLNEIQTLRWEDVDLDSTELHLRDSKIAAQMVPLFHAALSRRSFTPLFASCEPFPVQVTFPGS